MVRHIQSFTNQNSIISSVHKGIRRFAMFALNPVGIRKTSEQQAICLKKVEQDL